MNKELTEYKDNTLDLILSGTSLPMEFKTLGSKELQAIADGMPAVRRNMEIFGRKNSQVTSKLMSLQMLKLGPYNAIRQCDAQINRKKDAVKENYFKVLKEINKIEKLEHDLEYKDIDKFSARSIKIEVDKLRTNLADMRVHYEHSLKEILMYMETKKEIMEAHNISEDWSEEEWIEAELKENLMTAFQHALRDIQVTGNANMGTLEFLEQFGVNPVIAYAEARKYLSEMRGEIDVTALYRWYDEMYLKYKDEYKKAMKRLGIKNLVTENVAYKGVI